MKKQVWFHTMLCIYALAFVLTGCSKSNKGDDNPANNNVWDIEKQGIPKFVSTNYIELDKIFEISRFRSSYGHDYADAFEQCRSMKHYFEPKASVDWASIKIFSPIAGKIDRIEYEWAGRKIDIISSEHPAFRFTIFHIDTLIKLNVNDEVVAGQQLGNHIGSQTMSDISIFVNAPDNQPRLVSYFDVMTDELFNEYIKLGVKTRADFIISKEERDAHPLTCSNGVFTSSDALSNWVVIHTSFK